MSETREQKAQRMADLMMSVAKDKGECTESDLRLAGFTDDEIRKVRPLAEGFIASKSKTY